MITGTHLSETAQWIGWFRDLWTSNVPLRLHLRDLGDDGNPELHPQFVHWLDGTTSRDGDEDRARLKRAVKRLRERSLREYEVLYRVMVLGEPIPDTAEWLCARAATRGHAERYTARDVMVILYAAVDKIRDWY
ncbi:MAG TPA: hypothetical protein VFX15_02995 [Actinomycetes bacterium]|nr:hypothetical protein [Actinomycetes bacterium]